MDDLQQFVEDAIADNDELLEQKIQEARRLRKQKEFEIEALEALLEKLRSQQSSAKREKMPF